jgi:lysophospholipase L1-like esterase
MIRRSRLVILFLSITLLASLVINAVLFSWARRYYLELNETRLNPLGLDSFASDAYVTDKPLVVFFGDSRAADWPAPDVDRFAFVNRGLGAQTSAQTLLRFDAHVASLRPRVVIVQVGVNDLKTVALFPERRQAIVATCVSNIRHIVVRSVDLGATVILTTIFPVGNVPLERAPFWSPDVAASIREVNTAIRLLAAPNVVVFDAYGLLADADTGLLRPAYAEDELHLNTAGYAALDAELSRLLAAIE